MVIAGAVSWLFLLLLLFFDEGEVFMDLDEAVGVWVGWWLVVCDFLFL